MPINSLRCSSFIFLVLSSLCCAMISAMIASSSVECVVVGAITGRGTVPQVFINGTLIGGADELERWLEDREATAVLGAV